jgi:hypothetical protein
MSLDVRQSAAADCDAKLSVPVERSDQRRIGKLRVSRALRQDEDTAKTRTHLLIWRPAWR